MSVVWSNKLGWILCHSRFLSETFHSNEDVSYCTNCGRFKIFHISSQFLRLGQKFDNNSLKANPSNIDTDPSVIETRQIKQDFENLVSETKRQELNYFQKTCPLEQIQNSIAVDAAQVIFKSTAYTKRFEYFRGGNTNSWPVVVTFQDQKYLIPPVCSFFCCDVTKLASKIESGDIGQFDVVVLDPPWWNKHVRRRNSYESSEGYELMHEKDLIPLPINELLSTNGLVVVWCTNSRQQLKFLVEKLFPSWGIHYISTWYWVKVTENGEPVCKFSNQLGKKQPFERIIFGCRTCRKGKLKNPEPNKLIISIPSSIHSHKPPLTRVLAEYIPHGARCIELFARYLIPNWTSCGNEVLKLQHELLFK